MKKIKLLSLLLSLFTLVVLTESCNKEDDLDSCASVTCKNDGVCNDGTCNCPDGFSGTTCEIQDLCFGVTCKNEGTCAAGICDCPDGYIGSTCENFDSTQVQALLDGGQSPKALFDGGISLDKLYGKLYQGGYLFYLNTNNGTGMVAATTENSGAPWGCLGTEIKDARGEMVGDGQANTTAILANCTQAGIAALLCDELTLDGKSDWFLPSIDELNLMYTNLHVNGHGDFADDIYWSSTEFAPASSGAWYYRFKEGEKVGYDKAFNTYVRAARAF